MGEGRKLGHYKAGEARDGNQGEDEVVEGGGTLLKVERGREGG